MAARNHRHASKFQNRRQQPPGNCGCSRLTGLAPFLSTTAGSSTFGSKIIVKRSSCVPALALGSNLPSTCRRVRLSPVLFPDGNFAAAFGVDSRPTQRSVAPCWIRRALGFEGSRCCLYETWAMNRPAAEARQRNGAGRSCGLSGFEIRQKRTSGLLIPWRASTPGRQAVLPRPMCCQWGLKQICGEVGGRPHSCGPAEAEDSRNTP